MNNKIKILFLSKDQAGVQYFRTQTPAIELERLYGDQFEVDIETEVNFSDPEVIEGLKKYHIIHYHQRLVDDIRSMNDIKRKLPDIKFVLDIDDYWYLDKKHPLYNMSVEYKLPLITMENLKLADFVTTTTEAFAEEIRKVTGKNNVFVLYNSVNPESMKQFENNWKPDPNGRVRITYAGGSSHSGDIKQLEGVINMLNADSNLKDKFTIKLAGWDTEGSINTVSFNPELIEVLKAKNLWTIETVKILNKSKGNIEMISKLSDTVKDQFRNNVFKQEQRPIKSEESVYYNYEQILTDNHKIINDKDYYNWLMSFNKMNYYGNEGIYARRWTQKANVYAKVLDETDIVIAPLDNNKFNMMKSNLKQVECWTRKLPIVCSDMIPYNVDGRHMENCILIPTEKNARKYWVKYLKKLILDANLRKKLGEQLYEDFSVKYSLTNVTEKRAKFYKTIVAKTL